MLCLCLQGLQGEHDELEKAFRKEKQELEEKYAKLYGEGEKGAMLRGGGYTWAGTRGGGFSRHARVGEGLECSGGGGGRGGGGGGRGGTCTAIKMLKGRLRGVDTGGPTGYRG